MRTLFRIIRWPFRVLFKIVAWTITLTLGALAGFLLAMAQKK